MSRQPTPKSMARRIVRQLRESADPRVAEQGKSYFKSHEKIHLLGVPTPAIRQTEKDTHRLTAGSWSGSDARDFCDLLIRNRHLEVKAVGILLLSRHIPTAGLASLGQIEAWISGGFCSNWGTIDLLSGSLLAPLIRRYPELLGRLASWTRSDSLWFRRAAAVSLIPLVRRGERIDEAYIVAEALLSDGEDLIHKAVGWLLREAGKSEPQRLESFLLSRGRRIPRTTLRYAVERFPARKRKELLERTRS